MFEAAGIRLPELTGIRYDPADPGRPDLNLYGREIRVSGKGSRPRVVTVSFEAARALDRYLRARAGHPLAGCPELWPGKPPALWCRCERGSPDLDVRSP